MFNDYLRPRRVLPSTGNLRALIQMVISVSKLGDALTLTALTAWSDLQQKKTVCACRRRMFSVSGSFPGDTSSELYNYTYFEIVKYAKSI